MDNDSAAYWDQVRKAVEMADRASAVPPPAAPIDAMVPSPEADHFDSRASMHLRIAAEIRNARNGVNPMGPATPATVKAMVAASTQELLEEVTRRMALTQNSTAGRDLGRRCLEAAEKLDGAILRWRPAEGYPAPAPAAAEAADA